MSAERSTPEQPLQRAFNPCHLLHRSPLGLGSPLVFRIQIQQLKKENWQLGSEAGNNIIP